MNPQRELEKGQMKIPDEVDLEDANIGISGPVETFESRRLNGRWRVSPLREAGTLLGVLKQEGLAGKGLIEAFERWAPQIIGASRADMNRLYREQTGREMADHILIQKADKIVRYKQLPPEAEVFRRIISRTRESDSGREAVARQNRARSQRGVAVMYKVRVEVRTAKGNHDATVLVAAPTGREAANRACSEVTEFFGVPAKATRAAHAKEYALEEFLVVDGFVVEQGYSQSTTGVNRRRTK